MVMWGVAVLSYAVATAPQGVSLIGGYVTILLLALFGLHEASRLAHQRTERKRIAEETAAKCRKGGIGSESGH